ncbi:hypothetical protein SBA4_630004 [Candidatus Sulfopaludibacter sp. SbA4]|nr:hypothetical protein SBA4_630004 [Candidatus Sulfopaludibacter sp. SbA4]
MQEMEGKDAGQMELYGMFAGAGPGTAGDTMTARWSRSVQRSGCRRAHGLNGGRRGVHRFGWEGGGPGGQADRASSAGRCFPLVS